MRHLIITGSVRHRTRSMRQSSCPPSTDYGLRSLLRPGCAFALAAALSLSLVISDDAEAQRVGRIQAERALPAGTLMRVQNQDIGPGAAASAASRATGGRVLNVKRQSRGGRVVYVVKVLMDGGKLRVVRVDGRSGRVQ